MTVIINYFFGVAPKFSHFTSSGLEARCILGFSYIVTPLTL